MARNTSSIIWSCCFVQESNICRIPLIEEVREDGDSSYNKSSVLTSKIFAKDTRTGRLNFVLPVSIWLI